MLTPEYLATASEYLVRLYDDLEDNIIRDIARRIVKTGELTDTANIQYRQLQHLGALQDDILRRVAEHAGKSDAEIRRIFGEAMNINIQSNVAPLIRNGIEVEMNLSPQMRQILDAMVDRTAGNIHNLTLTTGSTGGQLYMECSNEAFMKASSGAFSPAEAIYQAVKKAGREGATVAFPSRNDKLDVAIRRNVLTSLNQTAGRITELNAAELDAEYYETSAHPGARPSHAEWQGQVFKIEGATADYPNFEDSTGYGEAGGLCGVNCRHTFYPFWPGLSERAYSPEKLSEYANHTVEYNGDEYHDYEASQMQRAMERSIRESKRVLTGIEAARSEAGNEETLERLNDGFSAESVKLKEKEAKLKDFLRQTGRDAENDRVRVHGFNKSVSQKSIHAANKRFQQEAKETGAIFGGPKTLAERLNLRYSDKKESDLYDLYVKQVRKGMVTPLVTFENYKKLHADIENRVVGMVTANGTEIKAQSKHFMERVIGTLDDPKKHEIRRGVDIDDIVDALKNPLKVADPISDRSGNRSQKYIGLRATISVNPDTGSLIQCNPTKAQLAKGLIKK